MRDIGAQLKALGFKSVHPDNDTGDFAVFDDSDGGGQYIRHWFSDKQCPFPEFIRKPLERRPDQDFTRRNEETVALMAADEKERDDLMKAAEIVRQSIAQVEEVTRVSSIEIARLTEVIQTQALQIAALTKDAKPATKTAKK